MPSPIASTDRLLISKKRLISVLFRLGLLPSSNDSNGIDEIVLIINLLWEEARLDYIDLKLDEEELECNDFEIQKGDEGDLIELGALKLTLYAVAYNQPSWFRKYCMPCASAPETVSKSKMKRSGGELVKHDVAKCPMCAGVLGCPKHDDDDVSYDTHDDAATNDKPKRVQLFETPSKDDRGDIELRAVRGIKSRNRVTRQ